jgi:hypothetical protein
MSNNDNKEYEPTNFNANLRTCEENKEKIMRTQPLTRGWINPQKNRTNNWLFKDKNYSLDQLGGLECLDKLQLAVYQANPKG